MNMKKIAGVLFLFCLACQEIVGPPAGTPFVSPAIYTQWRAEVESCAKIWSLDQISWFKSPNGSLGKQIMGEWYPPHNIFITEFVYNDNLEEVIKHEMMHDLLQGDQDHTSSLWVTCNLMAGWG